MAIIENMGVNSTEGSVIGIASVMTKKILKNDGFLFVIAGMTYASCVK